MPWSSGFLKMLFKIYWDQKFSLSLCPGNNWGVLPLRPSSLQKQELAISALPFTSSSLSCCLDKHLTFRKPLVPPACLGLVFYLHPSPGHSPCISHLLLGEVAEAHQFSPWYTEAFASATLLQTFSTSFFVCNMVQVTHQPRWMG